MSDHETAFARRPLAMFSPEDAVYVCILLAQGRTDPDLWIRRERLAVTRLHAYRDSAVPSDRLDPP